jgi:hypothetical protein
LDISRGQRIGRVSSEWFARPDDERYLNLPDLNDAVRGRAECAQARTVESRSIRVEAARDNAERLALIVAGRDEPVAPTHWSWGSCARWLARPPLSRPENTEIRKAISDGFFFLVRYPPDPASIERLPLCNRSNEELQYLACNV